MTRATGFYWIRFGDSEPEVARWGADAEAWMMAGQNETMPEDHPSGIKVLDEAPLVAPPRAWVFP